MRFARAGSTRTATQMPFGGPRLGGPPSAAPLSPPTLPLPANPAHQPGAVTSVARRADDLDAPSGPGGFAAQAALSRRGSPYVWGAKGPTSFDCSGLTQWSWAQAGVRLGGDTYSQINEGTPVAPDDVRPGDLIFPTSAFGEDGQSGPGHVQLAISPTEVVHAPQSGDVVRVAPMPSSFVARRPAPGD
ncbi:MAG: C40 family peptidase [Mycobacteriaceae bacterium]|nr:C40 family peptidase [Mycobacteriaceae bacterium]